MIDLSKFKGYVFIGLEKDSEQFDISIEHKDLTDEEREDLASVVINFRNFASGEIVLKAEEV